MHEYRSERTLFSAVIEVTLIGLLVLPVPRTFGAQADGSNVVRLFRLDGSFSVELPAKINSRRKPEDFGFNLSSAGLEAHSMSFLTRLRSVLRITNGNARRRITEVQWRLDVYDEPLRSLNQRLLQASKVNIYPGETETSSAEFAAVLPDRMIVLLQIVRVSFDDGSAWSAEDECSLGDDLRTVSCKSK